MQNWLVLMLVLSPASNAAVIVSGGPFGVLTDAGGNVYSDYAETFDVTVTGLPAEDLSALYFAVDEAARPFFGAWGYEDEESWSSLTVASTYAAFPGWISGTGLETPPYLPDGSMPISCGGPGGRCGMWVGASQQMTFTAESTAYYSFTPSPLQMTPTFIPGSIIGYTLGGGLENRL